MGWFEGWDAEDCGWGDVGLVLGVSLDANGVILDPLLLDIRHNTAIVGSNVVPIGLTLPLPINIPQLNIPHLIYISKTNLITLPNSFKFGHVAMLTFNRFKLYELFRLSDWLLELIGFMGLGLQGGLGLGWGLGLLLHFFFWGFWNYYRIGLIFVEYQ